jgi:hypothetical protein
MHGAPPQFDNALADRHRIERALGAGGMAMVYLAADVKHAYVPHRPPSPFLVGFPT